jgi:hypothetical protein
VRLRPAPTASRPTQRRPGTRLIALYPAVWRLRYGDELAQLIEQGGLGVRSRVDLVRGALDAHLHPRRPSPVPVVAALSAGGLATAHALALAAQPAPPDWPGYLMDALPLALATVALLLPATVGLWLRLGDTDGLLGRLGIVVGLAGHLAWLLAIAAALGGAGYGPWTSVAATVAMAGSAMLGVALAGAGSAAVGGLLVGAALAGVAPPALGWPVFAAVWTAIGFRMLLDFRGRLDDPARPAHA